jgi:hypothetical protein|tara:strand:+ start:433 stop:666 length:234 start_codon:yes stop_codon:yes gene_type:complete
MKISYEEKEKLYSKDNYFVVNKLPTKKGHPYAYNDKLNYLVCRSKWNETGECHDGLQWASSLEDSKLLIDRYIEREE